MVTSRAAWLFPLALAVAACASPRAISATPTGSAAATVPLITATTTPSPVAVTPSPTATPAPIRYVAMGASDTVGVGASDPATGSWPARVATLLPPGAAYVNIGVSGSVATQARDQQLQAAIAQRPTVVSVWLAVNDMNASVTPAAYRDALSAILDGLVTRTDAKVFVGNVPDLRGVPAYKDVDKTQLAAQISAYNDTIASVAADRAGRAYLVDLFTGSAALVSTITVSGDGFHPSDEGYKLIAERFANAMRAAGVPLR